MRIVFMGTPQAAVPSFVRLLADGHEVVAVYTQPDRPAGRGRKITFSPVKQLALENNIAVLQPIKLRSPGVLEEFRGHRAEVAVVVAYGRILPEDFLKAFPHGAVNVHFSLLPKYRGAAPVNWAIVNGETETGVTTMKMDEGLDTGDILVQRSTPIGPTETAPELMSRLACVGAELLAETLRDISEVRPRQQDESQATFAPILRREDGFIDWNLPAELIANRIRGFQPFPGSFTTRNGQKLSIWNASPKLEFESVDDVAGTIINVDKTSIVVSCGAGTVISIEEVQPEGKRRMSAADFMNGSHLRVGEVLGS